jgi:hypothetical protein
VVEKLRRDNAFHAQIQTARSVVAEELFGEFKVPKAQGGQRFHTRDKAQSRRAAREEKKGEKRLRPLEDLEIFQASEEHAEAQEGAQQPSDRLERRRSGPSGFTSRKENQRKRTGRNDMHRQIWRKIPSAVRLGEKCHRGEEIVDRRMFTQNPVSRWIGRRCSEFSLWSKRTGEQI